MAQAACLDVGIDTSPPCAADDQRLIVAEEIRFSEIVTALSVALDITQGHWQGHCMRTALVGMRLADELTLPTTERSALFYALLLKDLGCSSNAAKMAYLFGADDQAVKHSGRLIDWTKPGQCLRHCWTQCAPEGSLFEKLRRIGGIVRLGEKGSRKIGEIRCERGAQIARMLQLPEATARAIYDLDEHWNGRGGPRGLSGEAISLLGRICCLAQTVEVFFSAYGLDSAMNMAQERSGQWFDPQLVSALVAIKDDAAFWQRLQQADLVGELGRWEPDDAVLIADEACLDRVSEAFALVVDAKSPWTYQHSTRVAEIAVGVAEQFGVGSKLKRDIRRAALLHDIGKLGVSNRILDKPGKPTPAEFDQIRKHPAYTQQILQQVEAFAVLADVAGAHHERLDGRGYHRGIDGSVLSWVSRVLVVSDVFEAMTAKRPYRDALPLATVLQLMTDESGKAFDPECVSALARWQERTQFEPRIEAQLAEVDRLLTEW